MSIEVELNGKAGRVCPQAMSGQIRCPLIVRQSSEDVVTGTVFGHLRAIRPHLWLGPLLNEAYQTTRFRQVWYRDLSIRFWERQSRFPPELLDFREGQSEIDLIIEWENESTTVWVEAKLWSDLAQGTTHSADNDQVLRGVRTLLAATGHIQPNRLFQVAKRRPLWVALLSDKPHPLVETYLEPDVLKSRVPGCESELRAADIIGTITWSDICNVVAGFRHRMNATERLVGDRLVSYLSLKLSQLATGKPPDDYCANDGSHRLVFPR